MNQKPHHQAQDINLAQNKPNETQEEPHQNDIEEEEQNFSSDDSDDQIQQKVAFEIMQEEKLLQMRNLKNRNAQGKVNQQCENHEIQDQDNDNQLDDDQREAFLYLHSVRNEKKTLLKQKKIVKASQSQSQNLKSPKKITFPENNKKIQDSKYTSLLESTKNSNKASYTHCVLSNFNVVIQNIKYMIKSTQSYSHNNRKFNTKLYESIKIQNEPKVYDLMKLTIGEIQQAIRKLSLEYTLGPKQKKSNDQVEKEQKIGQEMKSKEQKENDGAITKEQKFKKYSLWIYSVLALHQGWSSYKHFESLAQINFIIVKMFEQQDKLTETSRKSLLLLLILMVNVFEQRHLTKHLEQLIDRIE